MKKRLLEYLARARRGRGEGGQAMLEFILSAFLLFVLVFGVIDFSRAIHDEQVMSGLTRQGSDLASRGTSLQDTVNALVAQGSSLNLSTQGKIIVTAVADGSNGKPQVTGQVVSVGGISATSRVGTGVGNPASVPSDANTVLNNGQTLYVTEVFYAYQTITPLGNFVKLALPSTLYQAAFF